MKHLFVTLAVIAATVSALGVRKGLSFAKVFGDGDAHEQRIKDYVYREGRVAADPAPVEATFSVPIDHTDGQGSSSPKFDMRYIVDWTFYKKESGPILFYAGNEGNVWTFYNNSGFVTKTLAEKYGALVVFAEHRYYGKSLPFGDFSFGAGNVSHLTVPNVMADYVQLIDHIRNNATSPELKYKATILFGGSYGGMLATWLRLKYPQHFQGAIASSAPILWFKGKTNPNSYTIKASQTIREVGGQECYDLTSYGFFDLANMVYDTTYWANIKEIFHLCNDLSKPSDVETLIGLLSDSLGTMSMVNYPYATNFVNPLPAWPVAASCVAAKTKPPSSASDVPNASVYNFTHIEALQRAANVFYNNSGQLQCLDLTAAASSGLDGSGWEAQTCADLPMPQGDDPAQSCFTWENWYEQGHTDHCKTKYGLTPNYDWALDYFGGMDPARDFKEATNIVWANGKLDPWSMGGVTTNITSDTVALLIDQAAHHLDLRTPNDADPPSVTAARLVEEAHVKKWVEEFQNQVIS